MTAPKPTRADAVDVRVDAQEDFRKRHRKDRDKADDVWKSLVAKVPQLVADVHFGAFFDPPSRPDRLKDVHPLYVIKGLPHAFRAVYTVEYQERGVAAVVVEWIGDHDDYDRLFGYTTS